jgi:Zn-dependent M28 family amino/carboxypeptidase
MRLLKALSFGRLQVYSFKQTAMRYLSLLFLLIIPFLYGCNTETSTELIDGQEFARHMAVLAHDSLEGRKPFTPGETKTINYLKTEFEKLGLLPGNGDNYFQQVPMAEITSTPTGPMVIKGKSGSLSLDYLDDYVALTRHLQPKINLENSELVFAGYGIVAPEYGWNDYEGIDAHGKTVIVMVNDPGFVDSTLFKGKTMTYYGRWTYKYEEAARQGAAGVIIIHATKPASYGWPVVRNGWSGASMYLQTEDGNRSRALMEGWITSEAARKLFTLAGQSDELLSEAGKKGFKPVPLGLTTSLKITNQIKTSQSNNVLAVWPGTSRKDEYIIYTAHWDHLGIGQPVDGDSIYNGAADNASGTAALLEIARAFTKLPSKPERSIVFLAVTAEEQGLLGSEYYTTHPVYPPHKTIANINMDVLQPFGKMKDLIVVGKGQSELDEYAEVAAKKQGRYTRGEPDPSGGWYFRSDHFKFAQVGIPSLYTEGGSVSTTKGEEAGEALKNEYNEKRYHAPADEYSPSWDLSGIIDDLQLLFDVGLNLSNDGKSPGWKKDSEFKAIREESLKSQPQ